MHRTAPFAHLASLQKLAAIGFLIALALTRSAFPQSIEPAPPEKPKSQRDPKRLPDKVNPVPTPPPVSIPADLKPDDRSPDEIIQTFFDALKADRVEDAYDSLSNQIALRDRGEQGVQLRTQTQTALDEYGPVRGFELLSDEWAGKNLNRRTYLLLGEVLPLRWRFYFYKTSVGWNLIDLRVDDAIVDVFDEKSAP